jgi:hypothetical protein
MSGIRSKNDQWNYAAGGAVVGAYSSFNGGIKGRTVNTVITKCLVYGALGEYLLLDICI